MAKIFWHLYYKFNTSKTKSALIKRHCRLTGKKYREIKLNGVVAYELLGKDE